jgi:glycosyltransferase involved in cell wall biosynthesis
MFFSAIEKIDDMIKVQVYGNVLDMFKLNNEHVLFEGRVDQKALAKAYEGSDALLFIDNKFGLQTSGKIFELLAFKKPIIFLYNNEESLVYTYAKHFSNIFFIRNEESELRDQVMRLKDFIIKDHKYDYDVNQFSWDGRATQFKSIVKSLN